MVMVWFSFRFLRVHTLSVRICSQ